MQRYSPPGSPAALETPGLFLLHTVGERAILKNQLDVTGADRHGADRPGADVAVLEGAIGVSRVQSYVGHVIALLTAFHDAIAAVADLTKPVTGSAHARSREDGNREEDGEKNAGKAGMSGGSRREKHRGRKVW